MTLTFSQPITTPEVALGNMLPEYPLPAPMPGETVYAQSLLYALGTYARAIDRGWVTSEYPLAVIQEAEATVGLMAHRLIFGALQNSPKQQPKPAPSDEASRLTQHYIDNGFSDSQPADSLRLGTVGAVTDFDEVNARIKRREFREAAEARAADILDSWVLAEGVRFSAQDEEVVLAALYHMLDNAKSPAYRAAVWLALQAFVYGEYDPTDPPVSPAPVYNS